MKRKADSILHYDGQNPFSDSQARNFSDSKIIGEFYPTSCFWSLFNDQHEILLGTRGSGKTFLLKMMRRSMLKRIHNPEAEELVQKKEFVALYVPMHLEFVSELNDLEFREDRQNTVFCFFFNCLLGESLLSELMDMLKEEPDELKRIKLELELSRKIDLMWFGEKAVRDCASTFDELSEKLRQLYYNFDLIKDSLEEIPPTFRRQLGASLISVKTLITNALGFREEPTWIICVDEAEFLSESLQKCINSVFRADSNRIALKVATLHYYHKTLDTVDPNTVVSMGNDFNYRIVDMKYDSTDFTKLTDALCAHRLKTRLTAVDIDVQTLEDFLGKIGNDELLDYYRAEMGEKEGTIEAIDAKIMLELSPERKNGATNYSDTRKPVFDRLRPVFYVREMLRRANTGHSKPGWYAGATMVRKISQGNPRLYIQIMNSLFEKAKNAKLTPKAQHETILKFAGDFCKATQALETYGPLAYSHLDKIGSYLKEQVHGEYLVPAGFDFKLGYTKGFQVQENIGWLQKAIAYSRLVVAEETLINGINKDTKYTLSNAYAAQYWIPMRSDTVKTVSKMGNRLNTYTVTTEKDQMSFF